VVSGIVRAGVAKLNKNCLLGPDKVRNFKLVSIKSIHVSRHLREEAVAGELVCMCIKAIKANEKLIRKEIRRGMVIIDATNKPVPV
jgi:GTPase